MIISSSINIRTQNRHGLLMRMFPTVAGGQTEHHVDHRVDVDRQEAHLAGNRLFT